MAQMNPRRAWIAIACLAAFLLAAALAVAALLEGRPRASGYRSIDVWKIDSHQGAEPRTLLVALSQVATQRILGIVNYAGGHVGGGLEEQIAVAGRFPGRVAIFMELDLDGCCGEAWSGRELVRMVQGRAAGARGLGISEAPDPAAGEGAGKRVPVDAAELEPIWDMAWRLEIPVAIRAGDPAPLRPPAGARGGRRPDPAAPAGAALGELVRVVERHPGVRFIGARFGGGAEDPAEVSRLLDRLPNLYVDTASCVSPLGRHADAARAAILAHPDRVLFGTGLRWIASPTSREEAAVVLGGGAPATSMVQVRRFFESTWRFFETRDEAIPAPDPAEAQLAIRGLGLPRPVLEKVFHGNAQRLLGFGELEQEQP